MPSLRCLADPFPVPYTLAEEGDLTEPPFDQGSPLAPEPPALADIRNYQQQPGEPEFPAPGALEERVLRSRLARCLLQSSELLARVKSLESCECRRPACVWEGTQREDGATWDKDDCTTCICLQGEVRCSARQDRPQCLGEQGRWARRCAGQVTWGGRGGASQGGLHGEEGAGLPRAGYMGRKGRGCLGRVTQGGRGCPWEPAEVTQSG
uniref:Uncharacterized protein n=1 Tax=Chrysemys picta bellii TaxID=8478 RepID=A0A8C3HRH5_CHRPI